MDKTKTNVLLYLLIITIAYALGRLAHTKTNLQVLCDGGNAEACYQTGLIFYAKDEPLRNSKSTKYFKKACDLKSKDGCLFVSSWYSMKSDLEISLKYLKLAISYGYSDCFYVLASPDFRALKKQHQVKDLFKNNSESCKNPKN